ncbi:MAG: TRAP transporter substrate-binding protein [Geminicoccaceae bacterium]|nr:TRAP transporter substrate-binding protein [Geminicoccaceae bacterium]
MKRRIFVSGAAAAGAAASTFPAPAISQNRREWRMVTTWPKNFPGLGTGAAELARMITEGSGGRLTVTVYGAGEIVPAFEAMDAVGSGTAEMGHGSPYYWKGKVAASQFLSAIPFGLTAQELNAWYQFGGGQELADELYAEMGTKFFVAGNTGVQMGGWFNKEITTIEDYRGLKMRIPGLGGEVVAAAGANVVNLPGGEIMPALSSGAIDATEWVGPYNDLAFGLYKSARLYYYPGWQEPGPAVDCFINLDAWESLDSDLKAVVQAATGAATRSMLAEFNARNQEALDTLLTDHGVQLMRFPDPVLQTLGRLSGEVMNDLASSDPSSRKVMDSLLRFRAGATAWSEVSEQTYLTARGLDYAYAEPSGG